MKPSSILSYMRSFSAGMIRLLVTVIQLPWTLMNVLVPIVYGISMLLKAVASDFGTKIDSGDKLTCNDVLPIVLVHGVFGFGDGRMGRLSHFGGIEEKYERVFAPDLGSLTSIYDRARQLFYYLKGGKVDYGEGHSKTCGHSRFGRVYKQGKYPEWDDDHPIHFVGHSAGAQVVRVLHQMLANKAFDGHENTSENWVASVTTLNGALNGSTRTYVAGMKPEDWRSVRSLSALQVCRLSVIFYDWLDISWFKSYYNFGFDHFNMSWKRVGVTGLLDLLLGNRGPFASRDWVLPDITIQGSMEINNVLKTFPNTFYFSYAAKLTKKIEGNNIVPFSKPDVHPWILVQVSQICVWRYPSNVPPPYEGYRDEDWWDNDGELNTTSMTHPRLPVEHQHCSFADDSDLQPQPGIWYYKIMEASHNHFAPTNGKLGTEAYQVYDTIFKRCRKLRVKKKDPTMLQN